MHHPKRFCSLGVLLLAMVASLAIAACGSSSSSGSESAPTLLRQTFSGTHKVNSGTLNVSLTVTPSGSGTLTGPITLSLGGPFQSLGTGKLPQSDFNISLSALGSSGSIGILSTGTSGYVTYQGASYELPPADFQRLESSFASFASSPGAKANSGLLGKLGIDPLHWLVNPQVVGTESVGGTQTTHIHAGINVAALLNDFNTFLGRASSLGVTGSASFPHSISAASQSRISREIKSPSFDVWTGTSDKTVRRLQISLAVPVSGQASTLLGGLHTAGIGLSMQYTNLNQPQTISPPANVLPYSQFQSKLRALLQGLQSGLGGALGSSTGSGTTGGSSGTGTGSGSTTSNLQKYSSCIQAANGDVSKMQRCSKYLSTK